MRSETIWLVSPVYFDVESYSRLRDNARAALAQSGAAVRFVAIDDSAGADPDVRTLEALPDQRVITPPFSLGHQRGLVFGLRQLSADVDEGDIVITLDADGEDQPEDLPRLLVPLREKNASLRTVAVAARTRRRETLPFKVLYFFFKNFFRSLTGTVIQSGNYAAYRGWLTRNVLFHPHFDLAYSSSLLSLGLNIRRVPCERGRRYAGMSKMTWLKLIQHGLRMLMPFADRIATRGLVLFSSLCGLGVLGTVALLVTKMTGHADWPGWALYAVCSGTLLCALAAVCMVIVFALFVQAQGLSLAQLDAVSRDGELERKRAS